jgi:hypothetical protein
MRSMRGGFIFRSRGPLQNALPMMKAHENTFQKQCIPVGAMPRSDVVTGPVSTPSDMVTAKQPIWNKTPRYHSSPHVHYSFHYRTCDKIQSMVDTFEP